jgi:HD-like signal output (HDOD) protein
VNPVTYDILTQRVKQLANLPAMPSILGSLTAALSLPAGKIDLEKIVGSISYEESLTAQVLRLANSALFRQRGDVATVRDAVIALGLWRIRDLAFSCTLPLMFPKLSSAVGKEVFWRHAFAAAAVSHQLGVVFANGNQSRPISVAYFTTSEFSSTVCFSRMISVRLWRRPSRTESPLKLPSGVR